MSEKLVGDLGQLVALCKGGGWTELRLESPSVSVLLSTDRGAPSLGGARPDAAASAPAAAAPAPAPIPVPVQAPAAAPAAAPHAASEGAIDASWEAIKAPNLGTFYRSPKPGSPPFVTVGQHVEANTEICLIEVMKLFTSVTAGVAGTVRRVAVADAELVEGGQTLLYIERD